MRHDELAAVAAAYLRLIRLGQWLSRLPLRIAYRLAARAAGRLSPLRRDLPHFQDYARALGLADGAMSRAWDMAMTGHGMFFVNNALHAAHPRRIARRVGSAAPDWQGLLTEPRGALVLTCHHDFHHSLFVLAGLAGRKVSVVAAPAEGGPLSPWLATHIRRQHDDCAWHFNGGRYIFTEPGQARAIVTALRGGELVFSLHDFVLQGKHSRPARLLGRSYEVPAGTIEIALKLGVPIYFAMLLWSAEQSAYRIECQRLNVTGAQPLDAYTTALEAVVTARPSAWHGWQWFANFSSPGHAPDNDRS